MEPIALEPVDRVEITTLVDNQWDMLLQSTQRADRVNPTAGVPLDAARQPV